jgi:hypothetical protein
MAVSRLLPQATINRFEFQIEPAGSKNGSNLVFTFPDTFIEETIQLYFNGVRQMQGVGCDYTVSESGGVGTGFDTITMAIGLAPQADDNLFADYIKTP